ncbi:MAG: hypothetical protein SPF22_00235 [Candidatus Onthovivens sp.]|nr:hypothetical protein [Candidatus Onthovivens sp.]
MKKRYARAKPIKKESEEENKITKWDIVRTLISVVILLISIIISIPTFINTIIPWFIETFL